MLDEVDAPLDDANVDRFCNMLNEMREKTQTRFIAITHNPVTMARMDRRCSAITMLPSAAFPNWSRSTCGRPKRWWRTEPEQGVSVAVVCHDLLSYMVS